MKFNIISAYLIFSEDIGRFEIEGNWPNYLSVHLCVYVCLYTHRYGYTCIERVKGLGWGLTRPSRSEVKQALNKRK